MPPIDDALRHSGMWRLGARHMGTAELVLALKLELAASALEHRAQARLFFSPSSREGSISAQCGLLGNGRMLQSLAWATQVWLVAMKERNWTPLCANCNVCRTSRACRGNFGGDMGRGRPESVSSCSIYPRRHPAHYSKHDAWLDDRAGKKPAKTLGMQVDSLQNPKSAKLRETLANAGQNSTGIA